MSNNIPCPKKPLLFLSKYYRLSCPSSWETAESWGWSPGSFKDVRHSIRWIVWAFNFSHLRYAGKGKI